MRNPKKPKTLRKIQKRVEKEVEIEYVAPISHKIIGYCPECDMCLSKNDFVSKMVFKCPCGFRKHKKYMLEVSKREIKREIEREKMTKKQYLADVKTIKSGTIESGIHMPDVSVLNESGK